MIATHNYGLIKRNGSYSIIAEGYDWYLVRWHGQVLYVPMWVFAEDE